jgi:hypothetical protein
MLTNLKKIWFIPALIILQVSCQKDASEQIPYVIVNLQLGIYSELSQLGVGMVATITPDTTHSNLLSSSYSVLDFHSKNLPNIYLNQRVNGNGIILYRKDFLEYHAFDLTCPYRAKEDYCALDVDGRGTLPICPCCKSVFLLDDDGLPSSDSKATSPLKEYPIQIINDATLLITN